LYHASSTTEIYTLSLHDALPIYLIQKWLTRIHVSCRVLSGRVARSHGLNRASFGKARLLRGEDQAPSKNKLYQKIKICQAVNKSFRCKRLEREKSLHDKRFFKRLLSRVFAGG